MHAVPYVRQSTDYTCGPASLAMVLGYHGICRSERRLARALGTNQAYGSTRAAMVRVARGEGLRVRARGMSVASLRDALRAGPVIVNYVEPSENVGHYAVVLACDDASITLADSWNGKRFRLSVRDFSERWLGYKTRNPRLGWAMASR